jgi:hypothetical protein
MRKLTVCLIACLVVGVAGVPASAAPNKEGSFTATAVPYADYTYNYPTTADTYTCFDGQEGVHKVLHPYKAARDGLLRAWIEGFEGDWTIGLFRDGELEEVPWTAQWITHSGKEVVNKRVNKGDELVIGVCNWSSLQTEIEVRYELVQERTEQGSAGFETLRPGGKALLEERVPVNFVFLGYDENEIDKNAFLAGLPHEYRPLVRMPSILYGIDDYLGIRYGYDYRTRFTDAAYEDRFFEFLRKAGTKAGPNYYQQLYNAQESNVRDINSNLTISAPEVERWLVEHPPAGADPAENTVVFINWHGRKDFSHHTYVKTGEPDTDAGYDASIWPSQATIAWGGTPPDDPESGFGKTSRLWFYDLSAGPGYWSKNYLVDVADTDGDGRVNYRMPPSWEYTKDGFRRPAKLSSDLSKVARYVAIDLLFTTSPLYTPALASPDIPETVNLDLNTYEGAPGFDASKEWVNSKEILAKFREWLPFYELSIDEQDRDFFESKFATCYLTWMQLYYGPNCYEDLPYNIWANFFTHNALELPETGDDKKKVDYEATAFNYVTPEGTGYTFGYADDNYLDGTQSFTHTFVDTEYKRYFGMTDIIIHEFGHHFGGSHPHDGYDYEDDVDFGGWYDKFQFTWAGTQNNSIMSYLSTNNEFSQFDRDNIARWMTSTYLNALNEVAARVIDEVGRERASGLLELSDALAARAQRAFRDHRYLASTFLAKQAYEVARSVARGQGVTIKGRWTGTKVLRDDEGMARQGHYTDASHQRYHRMFGDRVEDMVPIEVVRAVQGTDDLIPPQFRR